jgi:tetratricopeptide (TPR) repeat protein
MLSLYLCLSAMLVAAVALIAIPFIKNKILISKSFFIIISAICLLALSLTQYDSHSPALRQWFAQGLSHYNLMLKFKKLGGLDGTISRVREKLEKSPHDALGWTILGKLYLAKKDYRTAKWAFSEAHELAPQDPQIDAYYQFARKQELILPQ